MCKEICRCSDIEYSREAKEKIKRYSNLDENSLDEINYLYQVISIFLNIPISY